MECTELDAAQHAHWAVFPYALEEIARFTQEHEPDRELVPLLQNIRDDWTRSRATCGVLVVHSDEKSLLPILGHALLSVEQDCAGSYVHIWQANILPHVASACRRDFMDMCLVHIREWARQRELTRLRIATSRNPEVYVRRYGFTKLRTWLGMEV